MSQYKIKKVVIGKNDNSLEYFLIHDDIDIFCTLLSPERAQDFIDALNIVEEWPNAAEILKILPKLSDDITSLISENYRLKNNISKKKYDELINSDELPNIWNVTPTIKSFFDEVDGYI